MARHGGSKKKGHRRGRPHVPQRAPAPTHKRSRWWVAGILLVILGIGAVLWWRTGDRPEPTVSPVRSIPPAPQRRITAVLDALAGQNPQSVSDIHEEELSLAEALVRDFPQRDTPLALLATVHRYRGDTTEAEALWKQAIALNPKRSDLYEKIGQAAERKDQLDEAITWWRKGLEANPQAPGLRWRIANARVTQGHLDEAFALLQEECAITPTAARNYYLLGQIHLKQRAYDEAKAAYEKALEIQPDYYNAYYGLGTVYTRLRQPEQARTAMAHFQRLKTSADASEDQRIMIDEMPQARKRAAAFYGQAYSLHDSTQEAQIGERLLARALELDPNSAFIWEKLAGHHYVNGRHQQALTLFQKAAELAPDNPLPHINIGKLHALMNQPELAERTLRQTVTRFPDSGLAHAELARLYLQSQTHPAEALALMQKAVALTPTATHHYLLTWAYEANGDPKNAMAAIEKALALEPQNDRYRSTYERIRSRL
jgi:tetratricopeptide (TPR) repeat protein